MITRRFLLIVASVAVLGGALMVAPTATAVGSSVAASSGSVVSRVGVAWAADDATSGTAVLTYDNVGCTAVDASGFCTGGSWPTISGAHWVWRTQNVTPDEALNGTPWVTFTDSFQVDHAGSVSTLLITAADEYTVSVNGTQIGSDLTSDIAVDRYQFTPVVGTNALTVTAKTLPGSGTPYDNPAGVIYRLTTQRTSALSLTLSRPKITFGGSAVVKAHLVGGVTNRRVSIYGQPIGGRNVLVKRGTVSARGNLSVPVTPHATTVYTATYAGDSAWTPTTSSGAHLAVAAAWSARHLGGYTTSGRYRLYHYTTSCTSTSSRGCPRQRFSLAPRHPRQQVVLTYQYQWRGRWYGKGYTFTLNRKSQLLVYMYYDDRDTIGIPNRARVTFAGDASHAKATSKWVYWKVTN
jgi:hypothetical protein